MIQYIDKSDVLIELEKRYKYWKEKEFNFHSIESEIRMSECQHLMTLFNTLEVKEVNFGMEEYKYIDEHFNVYDDENQTLQTKENRSLLGVKDFEDIAKHFFELGLKVQKGE